MRRIATLFFALVLLPIAAGCADDPAGFGTDLDADQAAAAREAARQVSRAMTESADLHDGYAGSDGWAAAAKAAKAGGSCPVVTFTGSQQQSYLEVELDFGTGCTDDDGAFHQGMVTVRFDGREGEGSARITFADYANEEEALDGEVYIAPGPPVVQRITDLRVATAEETVLINMDLEADYDLSAETPTYSISGSGSIVVDGGEQVAFQVVEAVEGDASCPDPLRGVVDVAYADGLGSGIDARVDFFPNEGGCDDVVSVRIEERGTTLSMN